LKFVEAGDQVGNGQATLVELLPAVRQLRFPAGNKRSQPELWIDRAHL
jgi:hypothetical protein